MLAQPGCRTATAQRRQSARLHSSGARRRQPDSVRAMQSYHSDPAHRAMIAVPAPQAGAVEPARQRLRDSHLLAAGFYRLARTPADQYQTGRRNIAPVSRHKSDREAMSHLRAVSVSSASASVSSTGRRSVVMVLAEGFTIQAALLRAQPVLWTRRTISPSSRARTVAWTGSTLDSAATMLDVRVRALDLSKNRGPELALGPYEEACAGSCRDEACFARAVAGSRRRRDQASTLENFTAGPTIHSTRGTYRVSGSSVPGIRAHGRRAGLVDGTTASSASSVAGTQPLVGDLVEATNILLTLKLFGQTAFIRMSGVSVEARFTLGQS